MQKGQDYNTEIMKTMKTSIESKLDTKIKVIQDDQIQLKTTTDVI